MLAQHQAEGGKRGQGDGAPDRQRQVRPQAHHNRTHTRNQAGGNEDRRWREARFAEHARHHDDGVHHRQKRRQTGNNFLAHGAAASRNFKHGVK